MSRLEGGREFCPVWRGLRQQICRRAVVVTAADQVEPSSAYGISCSDARQHGDTRGHARTRFALVQNQDGDVEVGGCPCPDAGILKRPAGRVRPFYSRSACTVWPPGQPACLAKFDPFIATAVRSGW